MKEKKRAFSNDLGSVKLGNRVIRVLRWDVTGASGENGKMCGNWAGGMGEEDFVGMRMGYWEMNQ